MEEVPGLPSPAAVSDDRSPWEPGAAPHKAVISRPTLQSSDGGPGSQGGLELWVETQAAQSHAQHGDFLEGILELEGLVLPRMPSFVLSSSVFPSSSLPLTLSHLPPSRCLPGSQADNPSFPNPRRRLRLQDLADRVVDASEDEHELNQLLNEALLERESAQV
ncbi:hypothetical protein P7K49_028636 [Saguinus oedipus]|uniref:Uncharacterized protein n=1 Tax=Saguinus oedipus TaxID=9490 RepID=A0ABQ9U641_SAGOE|nr:hypothetical protein P7K49_028636 [Saguinus oedipus]